MLWTLQVHLLTVPKSWKCHKISLPSIPTSVLTPVTTFTRNVGQFSMFPASPNKQQHNYAQQLEYEIRPSQQSVSCMFISCLRMLQHNPNETATSRHACFSTQVPWYASQSPTLRADGHTEHLALWSDVSPFLNLENHSNAWVLLIFSFPNTSHNTL